MRPLNELVNERESALPSVMEWAAAATHPCEILPPADRSGEVLLALQVTTRSPLGAIAYSTGGIRVDSGYLRLLGSGHPRLTRNIVDWNDGRSAGFLLIADDVVGGFFALNGGALGEDVGSMYYLAPDQIRTFKTAVIGHGHAAASALPGGSASARMLGCAHNDPARPAQVNTEPDPSDS
ncbi:DUF2625 family protein [Burkholderia sp. F1]|uniref:DUF2625 family protein n=1 Tax=Burkholderia sp. F1 TaxID=3366817 RepID=UPI003D72F0AE